ncbi:MAG: alpha/beta hydrolase, partial [Chryseobacterium sp.]
SKKLAQNGFVAVSAEYRLSLEALYPAAVYDLKACIRWMKTNADKFGIDTNHIAVLGCSAGGQLASLLGTTNHKTAFEDTIDYQYVSSTVHAVVNIDGTLAFKHPESTGGPVYWLGGDYEQAKDKWEAAAPLNHIDKNTVPFIFLNSSIPRFHAGRDDAIKIMDSIHIYTEVHTFQDTPHPFWFFNPWFEPMMEKILLFLRQKL